METLTWFVLIFLWMAILFFSSAEIGKRLTIMKSFIASTAINLILYVLCVVIWLLAESDGMAQLAGAMIYTAVFAVSLFATAIIYYILHRSKRTNP
jgi:inner membrane protein involved in colicin E2 resistance